jgi:Zn-dependent protease
VSVLGVPIAIHITWFPIFALLAWAFSDSYFAPRLPLSASWECLGLGVLAALALYLSLLAHEYGHCMVARWYRIPVARITLFPLGCAARLGSEAPTPKSEFLVAIAGPIVSAALAFSFWAISVVSSTSSSWGAFSQLLAILNFVAASFNLVPIFPLDGGHVLRAGLWAWSKSFDQATRFAVRAGQGSAVLLVAAGSWMVNDWRTCLVFLLHGTFLFAFSQCYLRYVRLRKNASSE